MAAVVVQRGSTIPDHTPPQCDMDFVPMHVDMHVHVHVHVGRISLLSIQLRMTFVTLLVSSCLLVS